MFHSCNFNHMLILKTTCSGYKQILKLKVEAKECGSKIPTTNVLLSKYILSAQNHQSPDYTILLLLPICCIRGKVSTSIERGGNLGANNVRTSCFHICLKHPERGHYLENVSSDKPHTQTYTGRHNSTTTITCKKAHQHANTLPKWFIPAVGLWHLKRDLGLKRDEKSIWGLEDGQILSGPLCA